MKELILGCGHARKLVRQLLINEHDTTFVNPVTLDINPDMQPDIVWDLNNLPLPFKDNEFDEIHAYHVLEHIGRQGEYKSFFALFEELWRIAKPDAKLFGLVPTENSTWTWGDPGHTRVINNGTLIFLSQKEYVNQCDINGNSMTDYRNIYKGDWVIEKHAILDSSKITDKRKCLNYGFILKAIK